MATTVEEMARAWSEDPRWRGIERRYSPADVERLAGTVGVEHTVARLGAERLWSLLHSEGFVHALGAVTGNQAVEMVAAGLPAIYLSGWQVAGDMNLAGETYPDQSLYPSDSAPALVRRINNALLRADQIDHAAGRHDAPLDRADRRRRRGRLRRQPERLRADEGVHRGRRRRRPLRGSAVERQEVRPHGRQSAGADPRVRSRS
jgi:isocitrate lyase